MRIIICLFLMTMAVRAEDLPITRIGGATFKVANVEKTREFYTGLLGLEEAFDLKDASGALQSSFFKVNDDQYLAFSPGASENFRLEHFSLLAQDLKRLREMLNKRGITAGEIAKSADGSTYMAVTDPDGTEVRFVHYMQQSKQTEYRGKALGTRRVSDHLQHVGLAADHEAACMTFYQDEFGLRELFRGGPNPGEIRWINLSLPASPGDIIELMIMAAQPAQGRRHIAFEVPNMARTYNELRARGLSSQSKPNPGPKQNHRWILNLRDPNGIRVEIMGEAVEAQQGN